MHSIVLLNPPVVRPSEPPAGLARLCGALKKNGVECAAVDLNIEGLLHLMERREGVAPSADRWTARAEKNLTANLSLVRGPRALDNADAYRKAVLELDRLASRAHSRPGVRLGLTDYKDDSLSPLRSGDLLRAAREYTCNPFFPFFSKRIPGLLAKSNFAGISVNYLGQALSAFAIAGFIRAEFPEVRIIMGGGLITSWLSRSGWQGPFSGVVERFVAGPGEGALLSLLGVERPLAECPPDYSPFPLAGYLSPGPVLPYSASSGCWWRKCSFCPEKAEAGAYVPVAPSRALREIKGLVALERPALVHFLDNALSPAFLEEIIKDPPGAPWYGFARITRHLTDPGFCRSLKDSGCTMLKLGIESGDQGVLDRLNKGIDLGVAAAALKALRGAGIETYVYLLFGTPPENEEAARNTRDFVLANRDGIGFLNLAIFNLPIDSEDGAGLEKREFYEGDLSLYADFRHPLGWDRRVVRRFLDREFRREPAIAEILRRDPPLFTSNHAAFFSRFN